MFESNHLYTETIQRPIQIRLLQTKAKGKLVHIFKHEMDNTFKSKQISKLPELDPAWNLSCLYETNKKLIKRRTQNLVDNASNH